MLGTDGTIRKLAKRPSSDLGDLWVRLPLVPLGSCRKGWCSSRRSVKPLPSNCEAVGERFDSFTTHFLSGSVVYWQDTTLSRWRRGFDSPRGYFLVD